MEREEGDSEHRTHARVSPLSFSLSPPFEREREREREREDGWLSDFSLREIPTPPQRAAQRGKGEGEKRLNEQDARWVVQELPTMCTTVL